MIQPTQGAIYFFSLLSVPLNCSSQSNQASVFNHNLHLPGKGIRRALHRFVCSVILIPQLLVSTRGQRMKFAVCWLLQRYIWLHSNCLPYSGGSHALFPYITTVFFTYSIIMMYSILDHFSGWCAVYCSPSIALATLLCAIWLSAAQFEVQTAQNGNTRQWNTCLSFVQTSVPLFPPNSTWYIQKDMSQWMDFIIKCFLTCSSRINKNKM